MNKDVLRIMYLLTEFAEENPQLRFTQILSVFGLDKDNYYEKSDDTYTRMVVKYDKLKKAAKVQVKLHNKKD